MNSQRRSIREVSSENVGEHEIFTEITKLALQIKRQSEIAIKSTRIDAICTSIGDKKLCYQKIRATTSVCPSCDIAFQSCSSAFRAQSGQKYTH
jgi:uncharacterized protein (UPF0212 family)